MTTNWCEKNSTVALFEVKYRLVDQKSPTIDGSLIKKSADDVKFM